MEHTFFTDHHEALQIAHGPRDFLHGALENLSNQLAGGVCACSDRDAALERERRSAVRRRGRTRRNCAAQAGIRNRQDLENHSSFGKTGLLQIESRVTSTCRRAHFEDTKNILAKRLAPTQVASFQCKIV